MNNNSFAEIDNKENNNKIVIAFNDNFLNLQIIVSKANELFKQLVLGELSKQLHSIGYSTLPVHNNKYGSNLSKWNTEGVEAEILDPESGGWQKGKVRMRVVLEFCPDESEEIETNNQLENNSLDDIRKTIS